MRFARSVGITNSRLNTAKRGLAVAVARRIATSDTPVCLVGADPTDRDVDRHLPQLVASLGEPARMQVTRGPHHVEVANFADAHLCAISISDRESIELVFPALQERFRFIIVDAPSRAGGGVGIADVLLDWLDGLIVATGLAAGELAETRQYVEHLESLPSTRRVDTRVLAVGEVDGGGLARGQLETRLAALPTIGHVPRLGGSQTTDRSIDPDGLTHAFEPVLRWIVDGRTGTAGSERNATPVQRHIANRLYRETTNR